MHDARRRARELTQINKRGAPESAEYRQRCQSVTGWWYFDANEKNYNQLSLRMTRLCRMNP